jgi:predicted Rossmann fold flavoprotein
MPDLLDMTEYRTGRRIAIVGGGAGGMCAAIAAARSAMGNIEVHLFERNPRPGIKILISGGGKCNITHAGPIEEILREGFPRKNEQRFLKYALYRYTNEDVLSMLATHGVLYHSRENGRIFPDSARAEEVLAAFEHELRAAGARLHTRARVVSLSKHDSGFLLSTSDGDEAFDAVILATGGTSYRKVGTTGDGIDFAERMGHTIVPLRAALAPIYITPPPEQGLVGTAIRGGEILITRGEQIILRHPGDILLTHRGISGPAALDISRDAATEMERTTIGATKIGVATLGAAINLIGIPEDALREKLFEIQIQRPQQQVSTWLEEALPNRLVPFLLDQANIPHNRKWNALTKEERGRLLKRLLRFELGVISEIPIDRGEVTAGGVSLTEVSPRSMQSKFVPGLFFAGEMLDIAGEIGGYNLQAAYSTGWVAGEEAVKMILAM